MSELVKTHSFEDEVRYRIVLLEELFSRHGINTENWGTGQSKGIDSLAAEILHGESELCEIESDTSEQLVRKVTVISANVFYLDPESGLTYRLTEELQEFSDGRVRKRSLFGSSLAEKMKINESPDTALQRALYEEINIDISREQFEFEGSAQIANPSQSYPGLQNLLKNYVFNVYLNPEQFNRAGYTEKQPDKITVFSWEKV